MNKHTKLVVGILIVVLISLIIATISFSLDISKNSDTASENSLTETVIDPNGNQIIQGENHLYGVSDSGGNLIIDSVWQQLRFIGTKYLAATKDTKDGHRIGVLDLDGNVIAPFVYSDVKTLTDSSYLCTLADTDQFVIYNSAFHVFDTTVWDQYTWDNPVLTLVKGEDSFTFTLEENDFQLTQVNLSRTSDDVSFLVNWNSRANIDLLTPPQWSHVTDMAQSFLQMLQTQDFTGLSQITDQDHENAILSAASFPDTTIAQTDTSVYLMASTAENGRSVLTWQINADFTEKDGEPKRQTISLILTENQLGTWVATEVQIG